MSDPIILARGLSKRFGEFTAVDGIDVTVERGVIFAFLGANGSGKSTTIRMLIGLLAPSAGSILLDGIDVTQHPRRVRERIGYMGQKVSLYAGLTLRENVEFYAGLYGLAPADLEQRWGSVRERFDLASAEHERPENLPAGVRQRAGLALSTLHAPRLLFLDEPTAGVDVESRGLFWELIQDASDEGVTVFVTTHFLEEADYCDQVAFIDAGKLVADTTPEGLRGRFSTGYRIQARLAPGAHERVLQELARAGFAAEVEGDRLLARAPSLGAAELELLTRLLGPESAASIRIEQASMNDVFRRLVNDGAAAAPPPALAP
ncbi:MAG TPA: ABC transporter ATP-binding protein [Myxococcota bacterium]|jgi:ABC-2 type transport system ATP-binding protein